ncbi:MAG: hypothetical protein ACI4C1_03195 [Lachnospiraceae bacterium]
MAIADLNVLCGISHELNDTLILMNHSLERLEHTYPELQCYQYWKDTKDNYGYMKSLAARLATWQQAAGYNRVPINIEQLLRTIYQTCTSLPESDNKRIIYCCHRNIPIIYAVKKQLKNAIFSLLYCRLKKSPENTCLRIDLNHVNHQIILRVMDEGELPSPQDIDIQMEDAIFQMNEMAKQHDGNFFYEISPHGGCVCILTLQVENEDEEVL